MLESIQVAYVILYATPGVTAKTGYRIRPELHWSLHTEYPTYSPWTEFFPVRPGALTEMAKPESTVEVAQGARPPHSKSPYIRPPLLGVGVQLDVVVDVARVVAEAHVGPHLQADM